MSEQSQTPLPPPPAPVSDPRDAKGPQDQDLTLPKLQYTHRDDEYHLREALTAWNYDVICPAPHQAWCYRVLWEITYPHDPRLGQGLLCLKAKLTQRPSLCQDHEANHTIAPPDRTEYPSLSLDDLHKLFRNHEFPESVMKKLPSLAAQMINLHRNDKRKGDNRSQSDNDSTASFGTSASQQTAFERLESVFSLMISQGSGMEDTYDRLRYSLGTCPVECSYLLMQMMMVGNGTYGPEKNSVASTGEASTAPPSTNAE